MTEQDTSQGSRRGSRKRMLTPIRKYEIYLQLRQEATVAEAAASQRVDRSTITRIREVAKQGAVAALAASKPGVASRARDYELEAAKAEVARMSEALKEMAVQGRRRERRSDPRGSRRGPRRSAPRRRGRAVPLRCLRGGGRFRVDGDERIRVPWHRYRPSPCWSAGA